MKLIKTSTDPASREPAEKSMARSASELGKKALLALVTGAITFGVTDLTGVDRAWRIALSIFIASTVLLGDFLHGVEQRLEAMEAALDRHYENTTKLVEKRFAEIADVTELFSLVESSSVRTDVVTQFLRHAVDLDASSPLLLDFAHAEIARMSQFLSEISRGSATYIGEDRDWLIALTRTAQSSIEATSLPSVDAGPGGFDDGFWESGVGMRYLELQKEAADRGVRVRRIFVLDDPDMADYEGFRTMCQRHADLRVEVRILRPADVPATIQNALVDFILFDRTISYEADPAINSSGKPRRPAILRTRLTVAPNAAVNENSDHFDALWNAAEPFPNDPPAIERRGRRPSLPGRRTP